MYASVQLYPDMYLRYIEETQCEIYRHGEDYTKGEVVYYLLNIFFFFTFSILVVCFGEFQYQG